MKIVKARYAAIAMTAPVQSPKNVCQGNRTPFVAEVMTCQQEWLPRSAALPKSR